MSLLKLSMIGLGGRAAVTLLALVNTLLLARWLGPSGYGTYVLFVRTVSVLTMVGDLGQAQAAAALFGPYQRWSVALHRSFLRVLALGCATALTIGGAALWWLGDRILPGFPRAWLWAACAAVPLAVYGNFWNGRMIGTGEIWRLNLVRTAQSALLLAATLVWVGVLDGGPGAAMGAFAAVLALQIPVMAVLTPRSPPPAEPPPAFDRELLSFGTRGYASVVFYVAWTSLPLYLVNAMHGAAAAGLFSIAQQIVDRLLLPVQALQEAVYRRMSGLGARAAAPAAARYVSAGAWGIALSLLAVVPLALWGVPMLLGERYAEAARVTAVLLAGAPLMTALMLLDPYLVAAARRPGLASLLAAINVAAVLLLSLVFIPAGSAGGAAWALVLTQAVGAVAAALAFVRLAGGGAGALLTAGPAELARAARRVARVRWRGGGA